MSIPQSSRELITRWHKRSREIQDSQYEASKHLRRNHSYLGIPVLALNLIVGSSIFLSIKTDFGDLGKVIFGSITLLAGLLAGFQTFFKLSEQAEKHQTAGVNAGVLRRKIEQILAKGDNYQITDDEVTKLRDEYDRIAREAPNVPDSIWKATEAKLVGQ
jgi:hypothetical protein